MIIVKWLIAIVFAFFVGKLVSKLRLPSILGWLITGIVLGPYAFSLVTRELMDAPPYGTLIHVLECAVGLMIGTELVRKKIKSCGKTLIVTTLTQSPGTFAVVTPAFSIVFHFAGIPLYLAFIFGGIALATAPAPALSIVSEFNTEGPVTKTLRTCLHKKCVRIFEHNFVADKAKMRRRAGARQAFLTQSAAKFAEKTCAYACEDRFSA